MGEGRSYARKPSSGRLTRPSVRLSSISRAGVITSSIAALIGFILAPLEPPVHMALAGLGGLLAFPLSVYIVFVGSLRGGGPRRGLRALPPVAAVALSILAIPAVIAGYDAWRPLAVASLLSLTAHVYLEVRVWKRREPRLPLLYPPIAGLASLLPEASFTQYMLALALHYAAGMIMVVSPMTFARNYKIDPSKPITYTPIAVNAVSLGIYAAVGPSKMYILTALASVLTYFYSIKVWRALPLILQGLSKGGAGGWALAYGSTSHIASLAAMVLASTVYAVGNLDDLIMLHLIAMGFVGVHVYMYTPLMIPSILRVRVTPTMIPVPPLGMAIASILRPWAPLLSYAFLLASTLFLISFFVPSARKG